MRIIRSSDTRALGRVLTRTARSNQDVARAAARIVANVRRRGDAALRTYAERLDGLAPGASLSIGRREIDEAEAHVEPRLRRAIERAAATIAKVAAREMPASRRVRVSAGVEIELRVSPLARVGCYVPGGRNPLVSTVLMTAVPAHVAGVHEVIVACPRPVPAVLYAARVAGVQRVICAGGAQAIAALAYGTRSIDRVDKIVGPGNAWVSAAKALVAPDCAIDFYAGPTELVTIATRTDPAFLAADLVAQAEHDPDARPILLTPSARLARRVASLVDRSASRFGAAAAAVDANGAVVITRDLAEAVRLSDRIGPEHLWCETDAVAKMIGNAGTIFVGKYSVPALGDYATGSNHVLPTAGAARARGGLSAADFVKFTTIQRVTRDGARRLAPAALALARAEGLEGHAHSIEARL